MGEESKGAAEPAGVAVRTPIGRGGATVLVFTADDATGSVVLPLLANNEVGAFAFPGAANGPLLVAGAARAAPAVRLGPAALCTSAGAALARSLGTVPANLGTNGFLAAGAASSTGLAFFFARRLVSTTKIPIEFIRVMRETPPFFLRRTTRIGTLASPSPPSSEDGESHMPRRRASSPAAADEASPPSPPSASALPSPPSPVAGRYHGGQ